VRLDAEGGVVGKRRTILISVALLSLPHANAARAEPTSTLRAALDRVLSELHLKWRSTPQLIRQLDASQRSWERSATETCSRLVKEAYDRGTIEPVKEGACMSQAASQRAALLTSTFQSTLRN
jgi:uncharacterized protein YecT (DUF1311 family)